MRIALIGYGKMGQMIESIAVERNHEIVLKIDSKNADQFRRDAVQKADVAIEFTTPHAAFENVKKCLDFSVPVVSGSTGWNDKLDEIKAYCRQHNGTFLHASNFSIGVTIFFELNKKLAQLMAAQMDYTPSIKEIHHTQKKDAPSGTAVTLAEQIIQHNPRLEQWQLGPSNDHTIIGIESERIDPAPGTHHVTYRSEIDDIEIVHTAHNRKGFAMGAVLAAEYIWNKKGIFSMSDILQL